MADGYNAFHGRQTIRQGIHGAIAIEYANSTERLAASGFYDDEIYKLALELDTLDLYILLDPSTPTWALVGSLSSNPTPQSRTLTAGAGLIGGGDLSADRTFDIVANVDGSIIVNANDIQVGTINDSQHGSLSGGSLHALANITTAGFMSSDGYIKLDSIESGAQVNTVDSIFGRIGDITAQVGDYNSDQITNNSTVVGTYVSDALEYLDGYISSISNSLDGYALASDLQDHIDDTNNPHSTSIANIGSGTLSELNLAISDADVVPDTRTITAGAGLTGGGNLSADRTINVVANADGSIIVNADDIQVGTINDSQHGNLSGGSLHALANITTAGFISADGYNKLDSIEFGAQVNTVDSVFGRTGDITAQVGDYNSDQITNNSTVIGTYVSDALEYLDGYISSISNSLDGYALASDLQDHIDDTNNPHSTSIANIGAGTLAELNLAISDADVVPDTRTITAGAGLTGGGNLSTDRTINVVANVDGSIIVNANDIQVGTINDSQHGNLSGGSLHALANITTAGFMSADGYNKLDSIESGAQVNTVDSVFGRIGDVVAQTSDYDASQIDNDSLVSGTYVSDALNNLNSDINDIELALDGYGDVTGPGSSTDNVLIRFDGITGKLIQGSVVAVDDSGNFTGAGNFNGVTVEDHSLRHENGGADEISIAGLSGEAADAQKVTVRKNSGTNVGSRSRLNFIEGSNIVLTIADDGTDNEVDITITSTASGSGDVSGPASSTDNAIVRFDGITGKLIQNSNVTIDDSGNIFGGASLFIGGSASIGGKLTVGGLIDPTGIAFEPQSSPPDGYNNVVWIRDEAITTLVFTDSDDIDHSFLYLDGGTMTGDINMDGYNIINPGLVDGRDVESDGYKLDNIEIGAQVNVVDSVFGRIGDIIAQTSDYDASQIDNDSLVLGTYVSDALNNLNSDINNIESVLDGYGDVFGPSSSTDNAIVRFDGITGKVIQNSTVTMDDDGNIDMGDNHIADVEYIDLNLKATGDLTHLEGRVFYDSEDHTLAVMLDDSDVTLQVGQESHVRVVNKTGATIGNGSVVYIDGVQGNRPTIQLAISTDGYAEKLIGVATVDIDDNMEGTVTVFGIVRGIDTSLFAPGDSLYVSNTTPGALTNIKPVGLTATEKIGLALNSTNNGSIFICIRSPRNLADQDDVNNGTPYDGYYLRGTGNYWDGYEFEPDVVSAILNNVTSPVTIGDANSEGVAETFVRSDHVHALGGSVGGDLSGTLPNPTVTDLTISGEQQGSILYFNGSNWVQLGPGTDGYFLATHGAAANPTWAESTGNNNIINWIYTKSGGVTGQIVVPSFNDRFSTNMGFLIPDNTNYELVGITFASGSGGSSQATSINIRVATYSVPNGIQYSVTAGTTITSQSLLTVGSAQSTLYYVNDEVTLGTPVTLTGGDMLFVDINTNFWSFIDIQITLQVREI